MKLLREVEVWMVDVVLAMTVDDCSLRWRSESSEQSSQTVFGFSSVKSSFSQDV